jgi:hypothetical protein
MERVGESFQRHVEGAVPGNVSLLRGSQHPGELGNLGLRALSHVCGLVELPDLSLRDFIVGAGDNVVCHVLVGLIVADVLIGKLVLLNIEVRVEDVEASVAFGKHRQGEEHDPASGVERTDGELNLVSGTSLRSR